jgi:beta-lactamase class A
MALHRRTLLAATPLLAAWPRLALAAHEPFRAYERASGGRVGVHAQNVITGAMIAWRPDERFVMCSTFKASLAALVLSRVDAGSDALDQLIPYTAADLLEYAPVAREHLAVGALSVGEMCKAAVELSDNTCANLLLVRVGGPAALTAFWRSTGDAVSRLDHDEPLLNLTPPGRDDDTTTPAAMAGNFRRLVLGDVLSAASRKRFTGWLLGCRTGGNRLRAGVPTGWRIGDKTGNNGHDAAGDIAVLWPPLAGPLVVCAYTRGGSPTAAQLLTLFTDLGRLVERKLV